MPFESAVCPSCAGDAKEVKPNTYLCDYCRTEFKYTRPRVGGGPADCEIDGCGVAAIGRCARCGIAYCNSHRFLDNVCLPCGRATRSVSLAESTSCAFCVASTASSARCASCRSWVCDLCAAAIAPERECPRCAERRHLAEQEHKEHEYAARAWEEQLGSAIHAARGVKDPIDRLVLAARYWQKDGYPVHGRLFAETFPRLWSSIDAVDLRSVPPVWDSREVARWIARHEREAGRRPQQYSRAALVGENPKFHGRWIKGWHLTSIGMMSVPGQALRRSGVLVTHRGDFVGDWITILGLAQLAHMFDVENRSMVVSAPPVPARAR